MGCSEDCVTALRVSDTQEGCCKDIGQSISNAPPASGTESVGICGEGGTTQTEFGEVLSNVNSGPSSEEEIHPGTYVVPDFQYNCRGCIKSIQLAVSATSVLKDAGGRERIMFHTFSNRTGDKSIIQSVEDAPVVWNSSILTTTQDHKVVEYRPVGAAEICFNRSDAFGFTIEADSGITIMTRLSGDSNEFVLNASRYVQTISGCPQLNDIGLYTTEARTDVVPRIHIVTGKIF